MQKNVRMMMLPGLNGAAASTRHDDAAARRRGTCNHQLLVGGIEARGGRIDIAGVVADTTRGRKAVAHQMRRRVRVREVL